MYRMDTDKNIVYTKGYDRDLLEQGFGLSYSENYILLISYSGSLDIEYIDPANGTLINQLNNTGLKWDSDYCDLKFVPNSDAVFFFSALDSGNDQGLLCRG